MTSRVPDAVQRSPGDANGSRECAPDDRLRIVRSRCSAEPGSILAVVILWAPALRSTTPLRGAVHRVRGTSEREPQRGASASAPRIRAHERIPLWKLLGSYFSL